MGNALNNSATGDTTATALRWFTWYGNYTYNQLFNQVLLPLLQIGTALRTTICQDSVTINNSTTGITIATACDSLLWYGNRYTSTGTYSEILQTTAGCDSVVTLNLTINNSTTGLIPQLLPVTALYGMEIHIRQQEYI